MRIKRKQNSLHTLHLTSIPMKTFWAFPFPPSLLTLMLPARNVGTSDWGEVFGKDSNFVPLGVIKAQSASRWRAGSCGENLHVKLLAERIIDLNGIGMLSLVITLSMVQLHWKWLIRIWIAPIFRLVSLNLDEFRWWGNKSSTELNFAELNLFKRFI